MSGRGLAGEAESLAPGQGKEHGSKGIEADRDCTPKYSTIAERAGSYFCHPELASFQLLLHRGNQYGVTANLSAEKNQAGVQNKRKIDNYVRNYVCSLLHDLFGDLISLQCQIENDYGLRS